MRYARTIGILTMLTGCAPQQAPGPRAKEAARSQPAPGPALPMDETRRFPPKDRVDVKQYAAPLMGKAFIPGGNVAHYKRGAKEWDLFLVKTASADAAALALLDYKKQMTATHVVAHFGGFAGKDGDRPGFIFAKGVWLAGVLGLPEREADMLAREFAARLN